MKFKIAKFKVADASNSRAIDQSSNAKAGHVGLMFGIYALISVSTGVCQA